MIVKNGGHVLDIITLKNAPIMKGRRIRMNKICEPICTSCRYCVSITKASTNRYDVDCSKNPNLGGVTKTFQRCRSYRKA